MKAIPHVVKAGVKLGEGILLDLRSGTFYFEIQYF